MCLSVHLSDTSRCSAKITKPSIMQTMPRDSPRTLSFLTPTAIGGRRPIFFEICAQSDPPPFEHNDFDHGYTM